MKIIKVPTSQGSLDKNIGTELAPEILCKEIECEEVFVTKGDMEATDAAIYSKAKEIFSNPKEKNHEKAIFVGGDHSITYNIFKAFSEKFEKPCLLIFDAHADCDVFFKPVSHQDLNRAVVEEKLADTQDIIIIGIRKVFDVEEPFLKKNKIPTITAEEIHTNFEKSKEKLQNFIARQKNIYLSFDIDALDPSIAPGTGYLEENGLSKKQAFEMLEIVIKSGKVKTFDLVEINPK